jgi:hypothetical protein
MTTRTFPVNSPIDLVGRIGHGSFRVDARDGLTEATVELSGETATLDRTTVELRGSTLVVSLPRQGGIFDMSFLGRGARGRDALDVVVTVPTGTPVKVSTYTADITTTGRVGSADLASGVATIKVEDVDGDLRLRVGSGSTDVRFVRGSVQSRAGSGSGRFGEVGGELSSACGSGDITVELAHGRVRTRAGSGDAVIHAAHGDVDFVSGSGNVTLGLPAGRSARLDVTTGSGRVESEMPVESKATSDGPPVQVRIRTGSGDVRLVRAAA